MASNIVQPIYEQASTSPAIREHVALELVASWPIPVRTNDAYKLIFFYYGLSGPPAKPSFDIHAPAKQVEIDVQGRPGIPTDLTPALIGLPAASGQIIGNHAWPPNWSQPEMDDRVSKLMSAYDRVIPIWLARGSAASPQATELKQRFRELCPDSLVPYYRAFGQDFFGWLGLH